VPRKLGFEFDPISGCVTGIDHQQSTPHKAKSPSNKTQAGSPLQQHSQQQQEEEEKEGSIAHVASQLLTRHLLAVASVDVQSTCRVGVNVLYCQDGDS